MELRTVLTLAAAIPLAAAIIVLVRAFRSTAQHNTAVASGDDRLARESRWAAINRLGWVIALLLATAAILLARDRL